MQWFRVYRDLVDCQKVQSLTPLLFRALLNIWCLTDHESGVLPPVAQIAFRLRCPEKTASQWIASLSEAGLIDMTEEGELIPHNWNARQYVSDNAAVRVAKHRQKRKQKQPCNVTETVTANNFASVSVSGSGSGLISEQRARGTTSMPMTERFSEWMEPWPRNGNPDGAARWWISAVKTPADVEGAFASRDRYLASDDVARGIVCEPGKFLEQQSRGAWAGRWPTGMLNGQNGPKKQSRTDAIEEALKDL